MGESTGLKKIIYDTKYSPIVNIKLSVISAAIGRAKMYELLHKQLWRKNRCYTYKIDQIPTLNGRPVEFVGRWDIKSPSVQPYDYSDRWNLGLNQLFKGEGYSSYAHYGTATQIFWDITYTINGAESNITVYMYKYNDKKHKFIKLADSVTLVRIGDNLYKRITLGDNTKDELVQTLLSNQTFELISVEFHTADPKDGIYHDDCYIVPKIRK